MNNHYTVTMDGDVSDFSLGYWVFDEKKDALAFLEQLAKGCTALSVHIYMTDAKQKFIKGYRMGSEFNPSQKITGLSLTS